MSENSRLIEFNSCEFELELELDCESGRDDEAEGSGSGSSFEDDSSGGSDLSLGTSEEPVDSWFTRGRVDRPEAGEERVVA